MDKLLNDSSLRELATRVTKNVVIPQNIGYIFLAIVGIFIGEIIIKKAVIIVLYMTLIVTLITLSNIMIKSDYFPLKEITGINQRRVKFVEKMKQMVKIAVD